MTDQFAHWPGRKQYKAGTFSLESIMDKYIHCRRCDGKGLDPTDGFTSCSACLGAGGLHNPEFFERKEDKQEPKEATSTTSA